MAVVVCFVADERFLNRGSFEKMLEDVWDEADDCEELFDTSLAVVDVESSDVSDPVRVSCEGPDAAMSPKYCVARLTASS